MIPEEEPHVHVCVVGQDYLGDWYGLDDSGACISWWGSGTAAYLGAEVPPERFERYELVAMS